MNYHFLSFFLLFTLFACQKVETNWTPTETQTAYRLNDICFVNDTIGYATGGDKFADDITLKTSDGGKTWDTCAAHLSGKAFYAISFRDAAHGILGDTDGRLYMTSDSGKNWIEMQSFIWRTFYAFDYLNDTTIVGVGGGGYNAGLIWRYTISTWWDLIDTPQFQLRDVDFVNEKVGYACGYSVIMKTQDGGFTWQLTPAKNELFSAICFLNEKVGYSVGRTGTIVKTSDGGDTWQTLRNGNNPFNPAIRFNDVAFLSEEIGYVVGDKGIVLKTTDGGKIWKALEKYGKTDWQAIHLWNENKGIIVGSEGTIINFLE